jgi:hypothetical protein
MTAAEKLTHIFNLVVSAAIAGERCPENWKLPLSTGISQLCKHGRLKVYISGHNYRQVEILDGPHAGKRTAPDPQNHRVWKIVGRTSETLRGGINRDRPYRRQQPSKPREIF